jgi:hypothetical protein
MRRLPVRIVRGLLACTLASIGFVAFAPAAHAATTYTWVGAGGGGDNSDWGDSANWSPAGVPADGDSISVAQTPGGTSVVMGAPTVTLADATLGAGGELHGGAITTATMEWTGGVVWTDLTVNDLTISGSSLKRLHNPSQTTVRTLTIQHEAVISGENLVYDGELVVNGSLLATTEPGDAAVSIEGNTPSSKITNNGTIGAGAGSTLYITESTVDNHAGAQIGPGKVRLTYSTVHLHTVTDVFGSIDLGYSTTMTATGVVSVHNGAVLTQRSTVSGTATFGGAGRYAWLDGTIFGRLAFGADLDLLVGDMTSGIPAGKALRPLNGVGGRLTINGNATIDSTKPITLYSSTGQIASIVNNGHTTWIHGDTGNTGLPGKLQNTGVLHSKAGTGNVLTWGGVAVTNSGGIVLDSGTLAVTGPSFVQTAGTMALFGRTLTSSADIALHGGTFRGPGKVDAAVSNTGATVQLQTHGTLAITGRYTQGSHGEAVIKVAGSTPASRDAINAGGALTLHGTLTLVRVGTSAIAGYAMFTGASRTGTFDTVSGLAHFPGFHVGYTSTSARLAQ